MSLRGHQAALGRDGRLLLTLGETASRLGTGPLGIERLVDEGLLAPALQDDLGRVWFDPSDVDAVAAGTAERRSSTRLREAAPEPPPEEEAERAPRSAQP